MTTPKTTWLIRLQQGATFLFLAYVLVLLGRSAWVNAERNQQTTDMATGIVDLKQDIVELNDLIAYQETTTFKELEARRKLGLKKPGELVIVLPPEPDQPTLVEQKQAAVTPTHVVLQQWWNYYFKK